MNNSILDDVKDAVGAGNSCMGFDKELINHINTVLSYLNRIGIGKRGFTISGSFETWGDFLGTNTEMMSPVKTYVSGRVQLMFDPPSSQSHIALLKEDIEEAWWTLRWFVELPPENEKIQNEN